MARRLAQVLRGAAAVAVLALTIAVLVGPGIVCWRLLDSFGWIAVAVVIPIQAAWLMIASPLIALSARLSAPGLAEHGFRRRRTPPPLARVPDRRRRPDGTPSPLRRVPRFGDHYGLRAPGLLAIATLAVIATGITWRVAG